MVTLTYDASVNCYFIIQVGTITYVDALDLIASLREDERFQQADTVLVDARRSRTAVSGEDLQQLTTHLPPVVDKQVAIVVETGAMEGAYRQYFAARPQSDHVQLFTSLEDAKAWLVQPRMSRSLE